MKENKNDDNYGAVIWSVQPCRWHGGTPAPHYLVFHQFLSSAGEKQDKSVHSSSSPSAPIISTKEILREHGTTSFIQPEWICQKSENATKEVQYSLLFPDIFVSVGGDKQDFSNLI